jgi:hypothetical protein
VLNTRNDGSTCRIGTTNGGLSTPLLHYGNLGANNLKGPGMFHLNMALSRTVSLWEKRTFQLRAEAFNLPNHLNPNVPGTGSPTTTPLNAGNFGQITSDISGNNGLNAGDYRIIQLAMKFVF